jgi:hypothetical protein
MQITLSAAAVYRNTPTLAHLRHQRPKQQIVLLEQPHRPGLSGLGNRVSHIPDLGDFPRKRKHSLGT